MFSNLTRLDERTLRFAQSAGIRFATSVYSDDPATHGAITNNASSHARTIKNLKRLIESRVPTRAAVIVIDQPPAEVERTKRFLAGLGVGHVRSSEVRELGRGEEILSRSAQMSGLCGHCWSGRLCVAPDGSAYPCVMARQWRVGNVLEGPLSDIVRGEALADVRASIHDDLWLPKLECGGAFGGHAAEGERDADGDPEPPGYRGPTPAECPQSCVPDLSTPGVCPQSCDPFHAVCDPTEPAE